jgi:hypothetical protein
VRWSPEVGCAPFASVPGKISMTHVVNAAIGAVLVTGGSGYLGSRMIVELLNEAAAPAQQFGTSSAKRRARL